LGVGGGWQDDVSKGVWMTLNGGLLQITSSDPKLDDDTFTFSDVKIRTGGYGKKAPAPPTLPQSHHALTRPASLPPLPVTGIIDVNWKDDKEVWAVGGAGTMYVSKDGGKTFQFNKSADDIPGNLYKIKFFGDKGFVLGSEGVVLKYRGSA
jgi:hypothetical protein